jgi:UDP-N-acetylglucosamine diphosphorylase / glucose-1-phosphate thymidylyltransferase / UDP-N-acetylgalactosamine diphosphorylase / glucosamine-1-phosphate N-acetyltransferase / galactosamine-1-phosphate N-acetyltransferase
MQAVILAAGKGTRMQPLTLERPKPLVEVAGKPLLAHIINSLPQEIDEVIVVVGYKGDMIVEYFGDMFEGRRLKYVRQDEPLGTAHALDQARHLLHDSFLVMYGDDLIDGLSVANALKHKSCLLAYEHPEPQNFGVIVLKEDGTLKHIVEKPKVPPSNLVSAAGLVLHEGLFDYYEAQVEGKEYCIPDVLDRYVRDHPVHVERLAFWHPVNSIEQLNMAEEVLRRE